MATPQRRATARPGQRSAAPSQQRRNAAAAPAARGTRQAAAPDEEATPFDAADNDEPVLDDGDLPELIDLSGVEATVFELLPRGVYPAVIESCEYGLSQSSNLPMLTWTFLLNYEDKERRLKYWTTLAGDGAGRTKALLANLAPDLDLAELRPNELDEYFQDAEVNVRVTIRPDREDRSIKRNAVSAVLPPEEGFED